MKAAHTASTSSPPRFQGKYCNYCRQLITSRQYRHPLQAWCFLSSVSTENTGGRGRRGGRGGGNTQPDTDTLIKASVEVQWSFRGRKKTKQLDLCSQSMPGHFCGQSSDAELESRTQTQVRNEP